MAQYSLFPAFVQINYVSTYAPHKMVVPTVSWDQGIGTNGKGGYVPWGGGAIDAVDMITALATNLAVLHPANTTFEDALIFTKANEDAPPIPVAQIDLSIAGEGIASAVPAAMQTWTFRTALFNHYKLVQLDLVVADNFLPTKASAVTASEQDVIDELTADTNAWSGRDNSQITQLIRITAKLSDVLRKAYRLT